MLLINLIQAGDSFIASGGCHDVILIDFEQVFRESRNKLDDFGFQSGIDGPVQPLDVIRFHIQPHKPVFLRYIHIHNPIIKIRAIFAGRIHRRDDFDPFRQRISVDFPIQYQVHELLLHGMFAAIDLVDEQQDGSAPGYFLVNFPEFMMNGIDGGLLFDLFTLVVYPCIRFDRRQAADFPFFEEIPVNDDQRPTVFVGKLLGQSCFADPGFPDDQRNFSGGQDQIHTFQCINIIHDISCLSYLEFFIHSYFFCFFTAKGMNEHEPVRGHHVNGSP